MLLITNIIKYVHSQNGVELGNKVNEVLRFEKSQVQRLWYFVENREIAKRLQPTTCNLLIY